MVEAMAAEIIKIDPSRPEHAFSRCRDVLRSGGVIAYPTETFYGLGADPRNPAAVKKLFAIKGRPKDQPILLLIREESAVHEWTTAVTRDAEVLMKKFWPGPLTLVFKARPGVPVDLTAGTGTIGLRVPGSPLAVRLLEFLGAALTGTSANITGGQSPQTAGEAADAVGEMIDLILDGGKTTGGKPSTVLDVSGTSVKVIREGALPIKDISAFVRLTP